MTRKRHIVDEQSVIRVVDAKGSALDFDPDDEHGYNGFRAAVEYINDTRERQGQEPTVYRGKIVTNLEEVEL